VAGHGLSSLAEERARGFLASGPAQGILTVLEEAGLRGRGGAGFPTHVKWRAVAAAAGSAVVVANGHEGEPASAKDRWLLLHRPFLVLDGLLLAARAVGAHRAIVYVSREDSAASARTAVAELQCAGLVPDGVSLEVFQVTGGYVAGEESAVCRAINGGPALPTAKPPRPFERGVDGLPTLVNNIETLAHAAWIASRGADAFRALGTTNSPGTALFTLNGRAGAGLVVEAPLGTTVGALFSAADLELASTDRLLMGGWFGGVVREQVTDLACCYDAVSGAGSGLGCASITAVAVDDVVPSVAELAAWYAQESAR
jgi:NADH:ubiquinone oxidoreductase subunit F (NADH-binding)